MSAMRTVIISWDQEGRELYRTIRDQYDVGYVVERDHVLWGTDQEYLGLEIISFGKAYALYQGGEIDRWIIPCMRGINVFTGIYLPLLKRGVKAEDILYAPLAFYRDKALTEQERRNLIIPFSRRRDLDFLVLHIAEHCNLSCAQCSMFAGLVEEPRFMDYEKTERAVWRLKSIFDQILVIKLFGGEPLLNGELGAYCRLLRSAYPLADIEVVTNGTLVMDLDEAALETFRAEEITLDIAHYPVLNDVIDDICGHLRTSGIKHYISREIDIFSRLYNLKGTSDVNLTFETCSMKFNCVNMKEDKIAVCHVPFALPHAAEKFQLAIESGELIDLFEDGLSSESVVNRLNRPSPLCRFCNCDRASWRLLDADEGGLASGWSL